MRTRIYGKMLNSEIEEYLERNDIIFVPVGTTECHGGLPVDTETVLGEAFALKMAEKCDGLVLTNLPYFAPGATLVGRGTIQMGIRQGAEYLYALATSLLHQGFRRQIYLTGHGPNHMTISPVVRDFFEDTGVSILQLDMAKFIFTNYVGRFDMDTFNDMNIAGYQIMGRLEDVPLTTEFSEPRPMVSDKFAYLKSFGYQSAAFGYYFTDPKEHGATPALPDAETRKQCADRGEAFIDQLVEDIQIKKIVEDLRQLHEYNREVIRTHPWVPAAWANGEP